MGSLSPKAFKCEGEKVVPSHQLTYSLVLNSNPAGTNKQDRRHTKKTQIDVALLIGADPYLSSIPFFVSLATLRLLSSPSFIVQAASFAHLAWILYKWIAQYLFPRCPSVRMARVAAIGLCSLLRPMSLC